MGSRGRDSSVESEDLLSIIQICEEGKKTCVNCSHQLKPLSACHTLDICQLVATRLKI